MTDTFIIETSELRKNYDGVEAVRGLTLQVPGGSIYGFLGRNGAGKTTTLKMLLGMVRPTDGQARVFGLAADSQDTSVQIRQRTGEVGDPVPARRLVKPNGRSDGSTAVVLPSSNIGRLRSCLALFSG